jgi:hypothetical protein
MLKCQDTVFRNIGTKEEPKVASQNYDRIYFLHGSGDETEKNVKQFNKADAGFAVSPKGKSKHSVDALYNEMIDYLKLDNPKIADIRSVIMELVENSVDMSKRTNIGASLVPKEIDLGKALEKSAKNMVDLYVVTKGAVGEAYKDYETALSTLKAQMVNVVV